MTCGLDVPTTTTTTSTTTHHPRSHHYPRWSRLLLILVTSPSGDSAERERGRGRERELGHTLLTSELTPSTAARKEKRLGEQECVEGGDCPCLTPR
ncbi:hypothetical protein C0Q70_12409 [Pomacea canaliculata]|uniref:Uncharacterized protein n=1 Tax=Pomacea canaliculata TaxID=400727 RepID=A0A2T7P1G8_POMCA|nr:hypothetical protein C0Q70_12409 [Pomacea canaliculata]